MINRIREVLLNHFKSNINTYFFLFLAFIAGISAGAFTVNGLSSIQKSELTNYFQGFLQLFENQRVDSNEILRIAVVDNIRIVVILWILGVTIIGIPFIYLLLGIKGFITGFSSGFIIDLLGFKGVLFAIMTILPREIIIVPCIIALGVNGINFSLNIIRKKSVKHMIKENLKTSFLAYCFVTLCFMSIMSVGILIEAYVTPVFIRMIAV
ncbi:MAG: stage II sporulation protein M [Clostridiaceae bacterium]|nr:stage II sporulation protein M [Clostridiaceae bacterium]